MSLYFMMMIYESSLVITISQQGTASNTDYLLMKKDKTEYSYYMFQLKERDLVAHIKLTVI